MAIDLGNEKQVDESWERAGKDDEYSPDFIQIDKGRNYVALASKKLEEGYGHFIETNGMKTFIPCEAGIEGEGYAPRKCKVCALANKIYKIASTFKDSDKNMEKIWKNKASEIKASLAYIFLGVKGREITEMKKNKKGKNVEKKSAIFTTEPDDDGNTFPLPVQKLRISKKHWAGMKQFILDPEVTHIKKASDLVKYIINFYKEGATKQNQYGKIVPKITSIKANLELSKDQLEQLKLKEKDLAKYFGLLDSKEVEQIIKDYEEENDIDIEDDDTESKSKKDKKKKDKKKESSKKVKIEEDDEEDLDDDDLEDDEDLEDDDDLDDDDSDDDDDDDDDLDDIR